MKKTFTYVDLTFLEVSVEIMKRFYFLNVCLLEQLKFF